MRRPGLWSSQSFALLDDACTGGARLFTAPLDAIEAWEPEEVPAALAAIEAARARGHEVAGFFAYELGYALEPKLAPLIPKARSLPLLSVGVFRAPEILPPDRVDRFLAAQGGWHSVSDVSPALDGSAYDERFAAVKDLIAAGDTYQVNLTFPLHFRLAGSAVSLYRALRPAARAGHGALLQLADLAILSLSPELFLESDGVMIETRPMKGTAPSATDPAALAADPKAQAENLMIVDLLRNDLGRVAETGSVTVTALFDVTTYPTLHQMTSTIRARLRPDTDLAAILHALFPCGSVTGAPKIRAMEIIRDLEETPRGIYCGAIGRLGPRGTLDLNVAIRTLTIDADGMGVLGIGGGLVADSEGAAEYGECLLKARFLTDEAAPFMLIETLRWSPDDGLALIEEHLARLARSAAHFGFPYDRAAVAAALTRASHGDTALRIRLTLDAQGDIAVTTAPLTPLRAPLRVAFADQRIDSADPLLRHKTTRRTVYEAALSRAKTRYDVDEVIFLNERGEVTEGSFTTVFVERAGSLLTPPLASGLLPGTLRAHLIAEGRAREAVLQPQDFAAPGLYLGNSVRGLMKAILVP